MEGRRNNRTQRRLPFEALVELRLSDPPRRARGQATNISPGGIFVSMASPPATETELVFEIERADGSSLIQGRGQVVWARFKSLGPDRPAGVAIRFTVLDPAGQARLDAVFEGEPRGQPDAASQDRAAQPGSPGESTSAPDASVLELLEDLGIDFRKEVSPVVRRPVAPRSRPARARGLLVVALLMVVCVAIMLVVKSTIDWRLLEWRSSAGRGMTPAIAQPEPSGDEPERIEQPTRAAESEIDDVRRSGASSSPAAPDPSHGPSASESSSPPESSRAQARQARPHQEAPSSPSAMLPVARAIRQISAEHRSGVTTVIIEADGRLDEALVRQFMMPAPPRCVLRIGGILEPYSRYRVDVATPVLVGARVGWHSEVSPPELAVVLDLAGSQVEALEPEVVGASVLVRLKQGG